MLLALISAAFAGEAAAAAGKVDFATPGVTVAGRDGQQRPLARGTELDTGDTVRTSAQGRAQIRFSDGSYVSLQPNTDFAISDYKFEGKDDDRGFFGLVRGAMRTVTGAVGRVNRNSYRITTPTATVGIRGTGGVIQVLNDGSTLVIGTSGIWSLTNPAGSIDVPAGTSGLAPTEPNQPPRETNVQPQTSNPQPIQPEEPQYTQGGNVNPDGTAVIAPPFTPLVSGTGYAPVVAYNCDGMCLRGGDGGEGAPVIATFAEFNAQGQLIGLDAFGDQLRIGNGRHADFGTDGILAWGRWVGETISHPTACEGPCISNYTDNQGMHYVIGMPTPVMPTGGTATYSLFTDMNGNLSATKPTWESGTTSPGSFNANLTVNFGATHSVEGNFAVNMPAGGSYAAKSYSWSSSTTTPGAAFGMFTNSVTGCSACTCQAEVRGFFAGANAERVGIGYRLNDGILGDTIHGAAALKKN